MDQVVRAKWWRVPVDEVPRAADHEARVQWLYDWWERIDTWISENRPGDAVAPSPDTTAPPPSTDAAAPVLLADAGPGEATETTLLDM